MQDTLLAALQPTSFLTVTAPIELSHVPDDKLASYPLIVSSVGLRLLRRLPQPIRTLCFLRHPVARTIAHYRMLASPGQDAAMPRDNLLDLRGRTLEQILRDKSDGLAEQFFANPQTYLLHSDAWFSSRQTVSHLAPEEILAQAKANLDQLDFVGFAEDLEVDLQRMCVHFGWPTPVTSSPAEETQDPAEISPELTELICERNQLDLALYAYAREKYATSANAPKGGIHS